MKDFETRDLYMLHHLRACGLSGQPFSNLVASSPMAVSDVLASLKRLDAYGFIKFKGRKQLSDFEKLVEQAGEIPAPVVAPNGKSWPGGNDKVFGDRETLVSFFRTDVCLTLRGHAVLLFSPKRPSVLDVASVVSAEKTQPSDGKSAGPKIP